MSHYVSVGATFDPLQSATAIVESGVKAASDTAAKEAAKAGSGVFSTAPKRKGAAQMKTDTRISSLTTRKVYEGITPKTSGSTSGSTSGGKILGLSPMVLLGGAAAVLVGLKLAKVI